MINKDNITDEQKEAVEEVIRVMKQFGEDELAYKLGEKYGIVPPKIFNIEETEFYKLTKQLGIFCNVQGWTIGDDGVHYCIVSVNEDIRKLEDMVKTIKSLG